MKTQHNLYSSLEYLKYKETSELFSAYIRGLRIIKKLNHITFDYDSYKNYELSNLVLNMQIQLLRFNIEPY